MRVSHSPCKIQSLEPRVLYAGSPFQDGSDHDMAYGSDGTLHVAWHDLASGDLMYSKRSPGGVWSADVALDTTGNVGSGASIALDSNDRPAIAYQDSTNADLKVQQYNGTSWSTLPLVETTASLYPSIQFNSADKPVLTYYYSASEDLRFAAYSGTVWSKTAIDSTGDVGRSSSLIRVPGSGNFGVAYEQTSSGQMKFADRSGSTWGTPAVVDNNVPGGGGYTSLAYDTSNKPAFTYYAADSTELRYATRSAGGTWSTFSPKNGRSLYTNLMFNPDSGNATIVFYDKDANTTVLLKGLVGSWVSITLRSNVLGPTSATMAPDRTISYSNVPVGTNDLTVNDYYGILLLSAS